MMTTLVGLEFHVTGLWMPGETTVPYYGRIADPLAGEVTVPLNGARTASVTVAAGNEIVRALKSLPQITYAVHLKVYYNRHLVFWGPAKVRRGSFKAGIVKLEAVDMSLRMMRDHIHNNDELLDGAVTDADGVGKLPVSHEGMRLLRDAATTASFPALGISDGTNDFVADDDMDPIEVRRGDQLWNTMIQISEALGPDFELEPVEGEEQVYAHLNTYAYQGSDVSDQVQMHYGFLRNNLDDLEFVEGEEYTNIAHTLDRNLTYRETATNATAMARTAPYGEFDATDFDATGIDETKSRNVLKAYAKSIITARSVPVIALTATMLPDDPDDINQPRYLADFIVGDTISVAGRFEELELPIAPYRITEWSAQLAGEGTQQAVTVIADRIPGDDAIDNTDPEG